MKSLCTLALAGLFSIVICGAYGGNAQAAGTPQPVLIDTCLITGKFTQLVDFYQHVLGIAPRVSNGVYEGNLGADADQENLTKPLKIQHICRI